LYKYLLKKIYSKLVESFRFIPGFTSIENHKYCAIEKAFTEKHLKEPSRKTPGVFLERNLIRESIRKNSNYHIIDLENISAVDSKYLKNSQLSIDYILANKPNILDKNHKEILHTNSNNDDTSFQLEAIISKHIKAICPTSGPFYIQQNP